VACQDHYFSLLFFLDGFQAIICSALKLLDKGKRKEKKKEKSLPIKAGTRMKEISSHTGNSNPVCVFYMKNTCNLFNTPVNLYSICYTEVNEITDGYVNMAVRSNKCVSSLSPCYTRYIH
jgi:hypothetical protein